MCSHVLTFSICVFFFSSRRRHTRFDCDWSSDVCSSDLHRWPLPAGIDHGRPRAVERVNGPSLGGHGGGEKSSDDHEREIGRGAWRGKGEISGGAGSLKKKKKKSAEETKENKNRCICERA